jgi:hypothetical protein
MKNLQAFIIGLFAILIIGSATANAALDGNAKSTNSNDGACDADCSLREAVANSNSNLYRKRKIYVVEYCKLPGNTE